MLSRRVSQRTIHVAGFEESWLQQEGRRSEPQSYVMFSLTHPQSSDEVWTVDDAYSW